MIEILILLTKIMVCLVAFKAMVGFHFGWEKCDCCNKKYKEYIIFKIKKESFINI